MLFKVWSIASRVQCLLWYSVCGSSLQVPCKYIDKMKFCFVSGESIQIFAEIENCSSRVVVPKAAIYQTQAFYAKGKMKEVKQLVANLRGESLSSGKTETWNGKQLKIPPVSPSILDCSIIRVEYSLMVCWVVPMIPCKLLIKHCELLTS